MSLFPALQIPGDENPGHRSCKLPISSFIDGTGKGSQNGVLTGTRAGMQLNAVAKRVHGLASVVKGQDMFGLLSKVSIV